MSDPLPHRAHVWPWLKPICQRVLFPTWLAITIGSHIFSWRPLDEPELAHEMTHVAQWKRYGKLFLIRYLRASSKAAKAGGDRYRDNPYEVEAYDVEAGVRKRMSGTG